MPCKQGIRENIEASKEYYKKQKEYDPVRELWKSLVSRVHQTDEGFSGLNEEEKIYFSVCVLDGETYNGGIEQFFSNSSGEYYKWAADGLLELRAFSCLKLLREAKEILFGANTIPHDQGARYEAMKKLSSEEEEIENYPDWFKRLEKLDSEYYEDPDNLGVKLDEYAEAHGLVEPFKKR